jgi:predicted transcriptional regulator
MHAWSKRYKHRLFRWSFLSSLQKNSSKSLPFFFSTIAPRGRRSWVTSAHVFELFTAPGHRTPRTPLLETEGKKWLGGKLEIRGSSYSGL